MREIKFRCWDKKSNRMIESFTPDEQGKREYYPWCFGIGFSNWSPDDLIIQQYTGLKDQNGQDIFEGDIVKYNIYFTGDKPDHEDDMFYKVDWSDESCGFEPFSDSKNNCGCCGGGIDKYFCEVVGNIFEHPHLLKEG